MCHKHEIFIVCNFSKNFYFFRMEFRTSFILCLLMPTPYGLNKRFHSSRRRILVCCLLFHVAAVRRRENSALIISIQHSFKLPHLFSLCVFLSLSELFSESCLFEIDTKVKLKLFFREVGIQR